MKKNGTQRRTSPKVCVIGKTMIEMPYKIRWRYKEFSVYHSNFI
jgi:hypothetical protein